MQLSGVTVKGVQLNSTSSFSVVSSNYQMTEAQRAVSYLELYEECGGEISACNNILLQSNWMRKRTSAATSSDL